MFYVLCGFQNFFLFFLQTLKYLLSVCEYRGEAERK